MARSRKKAKRKALNRFADIGRAALVGAATVLPERADTKARVTAGECFTAIKLITHLLKKAVPERRPNGDNNKSFPSEHAAVCVAAAIIIEREYSGEIAAAAWTLAAAVCLARIESRKHYPRDVIVGAFIGCASVWISLRLRSAVLRRVLELS